MNSKHNQKCCHLLYQNWPKLILPFETYCTQLLKISCSITWELVLTDCKALRNRKRRIRARMQFAVWRRQPSPCWPRQWSIEDQFQDLPWRRCKSLRRRPEPGPKRCMSRLSVYLQRRLQTRKWNKNYFLSFWGK